MKVKFLKKKIIIPTYKEEKEEELPLFAFNRVHQRTSGDPYPNKVVLEAKRDELINQEYELLVLKNEFIKQIVIRTNVFDVTGVFNLVSIIDSMFVSFSIKNPDIIFAKFDYNTLSQSMKTIIQIDHSLCVAKFLWLYYKDAHLMSINHLGEICQSVFITKFYNLFFHWSWQVRNLFYYFVLYILTYIN